MQSAKTVSEARCGIRLFLCGDVMLGRGIDQILPHPGDPLLHETFVKSAIAYVQLAETAYGPIPKPVDHAYVWGDALPELTRHRPDARIINLETSITTSRAFVRKGINYKMHPQNVRCLTAASVDCCNLANNHVLDWGDTGLVETLETLRHAGILSAGAGLNVDQAAAPAIIDLPDSGRVLVFGFGLESSGIPASWAADEERLGINLLPDCSDRTVARIARRTRAFARPGDILVASLHWGANWGYRIPPEHHKLAHGLIDAAGFAIIHGHSAHHPKAIEIYRSKPILYGCGDFITDYEGISDYKAYRSDLALMYLPRFEMRSGALAELTLLPFRMRNFRLSRADPEDAAWLQATLDRDSLAFGTRVALERDNSLSVHW